MADRSAVPLTFDPRDYPATPYPGVRPGFDFVQHHGVGHTRTDEWRVDGRRPLLAYGSNACPGKIEWLRTELGLPGPVIVRQVRCVGLAAVWAAGFRLGDDQRPATLAAAPGVVEDHALWLATDEQLAVLDICEGHGVRYRRVQLHTGDIRSADGAVVAVPLAYVGLAQIRMPLLVDGHPVRCADVDQATARTLVGTPATSDGLAVTDVG